RDDPEGKLLAGHDLSKFRTLFLAGERADPDTIQWAERILDRPVLDHWWQTELGWPAIASCFGLGDLRRKRGSAGFPVPGYRFAVLDEAGHPLPAGQSGAVAIAAPLPPG
ncbi:AMP-binding protein, partial [Klebsiella pneumoniae]|uniref:AMP-binding protein n=1 Tax=Klebsiella pneumoniae TaxID=573 RepID=UPI0038549757